MSSFLKESNCINEPHHLQQSIQRKPGTLLTGGNPSRSEEITLATDPCDDSLKRDGAIWQFQPTGRLYGRDWQQQELLNAYENIKIPKQGEDNWNSITRLAIKLEGSSGVGKTSLALSLRPVVEADGGYFIHGKFDRRPEPHAVLISAFSDFAETF